MLYPKEDKENKILLYAVSVKSYANLTRYIEFMHMLYCSVVLMGEGYIFQII